MSQLQDKASSKNGGSEAKTFPLWRAPRWMRFAAALAMLFGYVFANGAGQALAQDQRESTQCANEATELGFNDWESWAWAKICAGEPANMADYPDTDKDNQPNCNPTSQGERAGQWPETRTLSPAFIEFIATHQRYTRGAVKRIAHVECAIVDGRIDLSNKEISPELIIAGSVMKGGITMADAHFLRSFSIERSSVIGLVDATGATFDRNFTLREGMYGDINLDNAMIKASLSLADSTITKTFTAQAMDADKGIDLKDLVFMKEVNLIDAKTAKQISIKNSAFRGEITAYNLGAGGDIFLEKSAFSTKVDFADLMTAKQLSIEYSAFKGEFVAYNLAAGGNILLKSTTFEGAVNLIGAKAAGQLSMEGDSRFMGDFIAKNLDIDDGIFLQNAIFKRGVFLNDAKTAGPLDTNNSEFRGVFEAQRLDAGAGILLKNAAFKQGVSLIDAKTAGELNTDYSEFQSVFEAQRLDTGSGISLRHTKFGRKVNLSLARVNGMLQLAGSSFADRLDLSHAHIANALVLYDGTEADGREAELVVPVWEEEAELILDNSYAGILQARMPDSWLMHNDAERPTSKLLPRSLDGFVYDSLHLTEGSELENEKIRSLIEWAGGATVDHSKEEETLSNYAMKKLCLASEWQQEETLYKPQPYTQLAEKLNEIGAADQADRVLIARFHHYYETHPLWLARAVGNISCFVSSYGVKPFRPLYLFIILVFLWAPFNYLAYNLSRRRPRGGRTLTALLGFFGYCLFRPLFHSFRNSIPIPGFLSYTKEAKPARLIYLLYAQKIIGLLLLASALGYLAI